MPVEKRQFPYKFEKLTGYDKKYEEYLKVFYLVGPKKYCLPQAYKDEVDHYYNFEVRSDDVWIIGYPRSGTTMSEELVWLLCNDLDYKTAAEVVTAERVPFFEHSAFTGGLGAKAIEWSKLKDKDKVDFRTLEAKPNYVKLAERKGRRFIKAHTPISLLTPELLTSGCKIIYLARNSKDVAISMFHCTELLCPDYNLTLQEHCELFMKGQNILLPHIEHVKEGWELRNNKNVLFIFYEDLNRELRKTIKRYADFLEKDLTEEELDKLEDHFHIDNFRKNKSVNNQFLAECGLTSKKKEHDFIRKGKVGGYKESLDEATAKKLDEWFRKSLEGTDLRFPE